MNVVIGATECLDTFHIFLTSSLAPKNVYPILCLSVPLDMNDKFVFYNTEQLSRKKAVDTILTIARNPLCVEVWDYSKANIDILASYGIVANHVPAVLPESYLTRLRTYRSLDCTYDVGFCGDLSSNRRMSILDSLKDLGYKVNYINNIFGEERDKEIAKCKIILNIHFADDYNIFESARCEPWLAIGVPVISETSLDNDERCINVPYTDLVNTTVETLYKLK
jgi:hypothetical protein